MAEWRTDQNSGTLVPAWSVRASLVAEWFWAMLVRPAEDEAAYPLRQAFREQAAELADRICRFWDDGESEYIELVVLAKRAGAVWELDPSRLLAQLASVVASGEGEEIFDSETAEVAAVMRRRLRRLGQDPELAKAWLELVTDVAAAVQPVWEAAGEVAVQMAVRAQSPLAARATTWPDVVRETGCDWVDKVPRIGQHALAVGGEVVLVPSWLGRKSFLLSFGDLVLIGMGPSAQPLPTEATRTAARRLRALADPTRLAVVEQLAIRPRAVGDLARDLQLSQPTISNHIRLLREAGVVREGERPHQRQLVVDTEGVDHLLGEVRALVIGVTA